MIRQGKIVLQDQVTIGPLKQGHGIRIVVDVAIDQSIQFGIGVIEKPGPLLGGGTGQIAADGLSCARLPCSLAT